MAEITPESDLGSIECFQNYTAPEVFIQGLAGLVNQQDVEAMIRAQKQMLQRFEKTNEMLINCNALSAGRLQTAGAEFKKHSQLLLDMKKDLDNIFKRIRVIKTKLNTQYPQAFAAAANQAAFEEEEEEAKEVEATADHQSGPPSPDVEEMRERPKKRSGSSSTDSNNGNSNNDSSPCTSDTG